MRTIDLNKLFALVAHCVDTVDDDETHEMIANELSGIHAMDEWELLQLSPELRLLLRNLAIIVGDDDAADLLNF